MLRITWLKLLLITIVGMLGRGSVPLAAAENSGLASDFGGFGVGGIVADAPLAINDMALLPDGRIIAVGAQDATVAVARFLPSGALDPSFGTNGLVVTPVTKTQQNAVAHGVAVQPDGRIVVAGTVRGTAGSDVAVLRYNADGTLDSSFDGDGMVVADFNGGDDSAAAIALDGDKRIIVGGSAKRGTQSSFAVLRLTVNGALDAKFDGNGKATVDFGGDATLADPLVQTRGEIVLAGRATVAGKDNEVRTREVLARLTQNGSPDVTFDNDGRLVTEIVGDTVGSSVALDHNGNLVVVGSGVAAAFRVTRYTKDGMPDTTFGTGGTVSTPFGSPDTEAAVVLTLPDGTILVAGQSVGQMAFARYNADGTLDQRFGDDGKLVAPLANAAVSSGVLTADGRLLAAGGSFLLRLFDDGTLDAGGRQLVGFGPGTGSEATTTLLQPDSKILNVGTVVQAGISADIALTRHLPDGQLDPLFGNGGVQTLQRSKSFMQATDALMQPQDGKILAVGSMQTVVQGRVKDADILLARFNPDGSPDTSCGDAGLSIIDVGSGIEDLAQSVALQADGKIVVAGSITYPLATLAFVLRLEANCSLRDSTFGNGGLVEIADANQVVGLFALPEGQIQLIGTASAGGVLVARIRASGMPDDNFGPPGDRGKVLTPLKNGVAQDAALTPDGKLLVAAAQFFNGRAALLLRYTDAGALDFSFGTQGVVAIDLGANAVPSAIALRGDGAIAVTSCFDDMMGSPIALFDAAGMLDPAFGASGKANLTIGGFTCLRDAVFSGERLLVGGFAQNGANDSFALAAYPTGGKGPALSFVPAAASVAESRAFATLTVRLSQISAQPVTVQYAPTGGTATGGQDYTLAADTLTFAPGQVAQRITVPVIDDSAAEGDEAVVIALSDPSNAVLGDAASFTLTITDDDTGSPVPNPSPAPRSGVFLPLMQR